MLILVTGATGFLGAHLLQILVEKGYTVRATRRANSRMDLVQPIADRVQWVEADVTDIVALEAAFEGVTHVFHCAAMVSFHARDKRLMHRINVDGTANVVNMCLEYGVAHLIHVSSIAAIGRTKQNSVISEQTKWVTDPLNTQYAISKYQAEQEVWRGEAEGLTVSVVNPSVIIGRGFWEEGTARFVTLLDKGLKFMPPGRTGFVDVRDVARFMVCLLEQGITSRRFLLNGENLSYTAFFKLIAEELGKPLPSIKVTPLLAELAWRFEWLKEKLTGKTPMVTRESARASLNQFEYDASASLKTCPDFRYTPIAQTAQWMVEGYRQDQQKSQQPTK
jgi:dihydroflavonol-4-reductase